MVESTKTALSSTSEIVITRFFDAPRELVWKAWTEPERLMQWWGPKGYTSPECKVDLRVGGKYLFCMRSTEGRDIWGTGTYLEIVPNEKLVMTDSFADAEGNIVPAAHYGFEEEFPLEMRVTVTLEDAGEKTRLVVRHEGLPAGEQSEGATAGWNESLDKMAEALKTAA